MSFDFEEVLEEFAEVAQLSPPAGELLGLGGRHDASRTPVAYVIHRRQDEASRGEAARRAREWYGLHREAALAQRKQRRDSCPGEEYLRAKARPGYSEKKREWARRWWRREKAKPGHAAHQGCLYARRKLERAQRKAAQFAGATCGLCGVPVPPPLRGGRRRWCSPKCLKLAWYRRSKEARP